VSYRSAKARIVDHRHDSGIAPVDSDAIIENARRQEIINKLSKKELDYLDIIRRNSELQAGLTDSLNKEKFEELIMQTYIRSDREKARARARKSGLGEGVANRYARDTKESRADFDRAQERQRRGKRQVQLERQIPRILHLESGLIGVGPGWWDNELNIIGDPDEKIKPWMQANGPGLDAAIKKRLEEIETKRKEQDIGTVVAPATRPERPGGQPQLPEEKVGLRPGQRPGLRSRSIQGGDEVRVRDVAPARGRKRFGGGARGAGTVIDRRGSGSRGPSITGQRRGRFEALGDIRRRNEAIRQAKEEKIRAKKKSERNARMKVYGIRKDAEKGGIGAGRTRAEQEQFLRNKAELDKIAKLEKEREEAREAVDSSALTDEQWVGDEERERLDRVNKKLEKLGQGRFRKLSESELKRAEDLGVATSILREVSQEEADKNKYTDAFGQPGGEGTYVDQLEWSKELMKAEQVKLRKDRLYKPGDRYTSGPFKGRPIAKHMIGKPVRGKGRSVGVTRTPTRGPASLERSRRQAEAKRRAIEARRKKSAAVNDKRAEKGMRQWRIDPDTGRFERDEDGKFIEFNKGGLVSYLANGGVPDPEEVRKPTDYFENWLRRGHYRSTGPQYKGMGVGEAPRSEEQRKARREQYLFQNPGAKQTPFDGKEPAAARRRPFNMALESLGLIRNLERQGRDVDFETSGEGVGPGAMEEGLWKNMMPFFSEAIMKNYNPKHPLGPNVDDEPILGQPLGDGLRVRPDTHITGPPMPLPADIEDDMDAIYRMMRSFEDAEIDSIPGLRDQIQMQEQIHRAKGFNRGGNVDSVPAMLTPGEFVVRKEAVDAVGVGTLQNINRMGYNAGGVVYARGGGAMPFGGRPYLGRGANRRNKEFRIQQRRMQKQQRIQARRDARQARINARSRGSQFQGGAPGQIVFGQPGQTAGMGMMSVPPQPVQPQPPAAPPLLAPPGAVNRPVVPGAGAGGGFVQPALNPAALPQAQGGGQAAGVGIDPTVIVDAIVQLGSTVQTELQNLATAMTTQQGQQGQVDLSPIAELNNALAGLTQWGGFDKFSNAVDTLSGIGPFQVEVPGGVDVNLGAFEGALTGKLTSIVTNAVRQALADQPSKPAPDTNSADGKPQRPLG